MIFRNPAARVRVGRARGRIWQPLRPDQITQTIAAATTQQARLFIALAAVHAARPGQIRACNSTT